MERYLLAFKTHFFLISYLFATLKFIQGRQTKALVKNELFLLVRYSLSDFARLLSISGSSKIPVIYLLKKMLLWQNVMLKSETVGLYKAQFLPSRNVHSDRKMEIQYDMTNTSASYSIEERH